MPTPSPASLPRPFLLACPDLSAERAGNTDTPGVWHFDSGVPGKHVMLSALIHGNELCGAWALKEALAAGLRPRRGSLTLAFCNLAAFDRFDSANYAPARFVDEDMNRVWSDDKLSVPISQERRRAAELRPWVEQADWLLDFHSMSNSDVPLQLTGLEQRNIDLALALVEADLGRPLALAVARRLVMFLRRPGGQAQYSTLLQSQAADSPLFDELHLWLAEHLGERSLTVEQLAERVRMSPRNFSRVYKQRTGRTPARAIELFRLEAARRLLEHSTQSIEQIARQCGFGNEERMRVTFQRHLSIAPRDYRSRFTREA